MFNLFLKYSSTSRLAFLKKLFIRPQVTSKPHKNIAFKNFTPTFTDMSVTLGTASDINLDSEYITEEVYIFFKLELEFFGEFSSCIKFVLY